MATNFPSGLDSLTNPTSSDSLNSPSHADQHANVNDAVEALEAKVGVDGSAVTGSLDYKVTASKTVTDKIDPAGASTDQVLKFNGTKFVPATGSSLTASDTPPGSPVAGELWYESDTGRTFIRYDSAWVEIGSTATTNVNANDLSGTTLASNVVSSSLTSVGTLTSLNVNGTTTVRAASTQDGVALAGRAGGTGTYEVTLTPTTLSADRTLTLPDATGTVALTTDPGLILVKSQTISAGSSSANVTSAFSSTYDAYKIVITGGAVSNYVNISLKLGSTTTGYYSSRILNYPNNGTPTGNGENNTSAWGYAAQGNGDSVNCSIELLNPYLSKYTIYSGSYIFTVGAASEIGITQGYLANTTSYTDFTLTPAGGATFSSGTIRVYGYRN